MLRFTASGFEVQVEGVSFRGSGFGVCSLGLGVQVSC